MAGWKGRAFFLSKKREGEGAAALVERDAKDGTRRRTFLLPPL